MPTQIDVLEPGPSAFLNPQWRSKLAYRAQIVGPPAAALYARALQRFTSTKKASIQESDLALCDE